MLEQQLKERDIEFRDYTEKMKQTLLRKEEELRRSRSLPGTEAGQPGMGSTLFPQRANVVETVPVPTPVVGAVLVPTPGLVLRLRQGCLGLVREKVGRQFIMFSHRSIMFLDYQ